MKILITNLWLHDYAGTECYTRDLAIALKRMGIEVEIYTSQTGDIANDIKREGINVTDSLNDLKNIPTLIHGHHKTALDAINRFQEVPAVYFCHSGYLQQEEPVFHPSIKKYVAVDEYCLERLISKGITDAQVIYNWVDINKFKQKEKINETPSKALLFSNMYPQQKTVVFQKVCDERNIELTCIGREFNSFTAYPETILGNYDIVFAKAKCAIEAMACGCAVILNDYAGMGEMIVPSNFELAKKYNFGYKMLRPMPAKRKENKIIEELEKYNSSDVKNVSDRLRKEADFDKSLKQIIALYNQILSR